jgi:hypothetical protein
MTKQRQIINHIRENHTDTALSGHILWVIAAECECAISTVYRALAHLRGIGALDTANRFIGRFIRHTEELCAALFAEDNYILLSPVRTAELCEALTTTPDKLRLAVEWAEMCRALERHFTVYGVAVSPVRKAVAV